MSQLETIEIDCPYCGEYIEIVVDCSAGSQEYTEDCFVCCRPIVISVQVEGNGEATASARREDD